MKATRFLIVVLLASLAWAQEAPKPAEAKKPAEGAKPAAAKPAVSPQMKAFNDAMAVKGPAKKIEALQKFIQEIQEKILKLIEPRLETPAGAGLAVHAARQGKQVKVEASVAGLSKAENLMEYPVDVKADNLAVVVYLEDEKSKAVLQAAQAEVGL